MGTKTSTGEPWSSRLLASGWLSTEARKAGAPLNVLGVLGAARAARDAAGKGLTAGRDHAFDEQDKETAIELKRLSVVLRSLRGIEARAHHRARPSSLHDAVLFPPTRCVHWPFLRDLERTARDFEQTFAASRPPQSNARTRGQRASSDSKAASNRYVVAFFERFAGRCGEPHDLAITEIALGRASACTDTDEFRERCKRWSKFTKRRAARNTPTT